MATKKAEPEQIENNGSEPIERPPQLNPIIHTLAVGQTGIGKSTYAATYPKPMFVFFWDGFGNDQPYLNMGDPGPLEFWDDGTPNRLISTPEGEINIDYYHDEDPENPSAYERFIGALSQLDAKNYATVVFDSVSESIKAARWWEQFTLNASAKGQGKQQWWGESADRIERLMSGTFKTYPCNVVVTVHLSDHLPREDAPFWPLDLPGRLSTGLPRSFGEVHLLRFGTDYEGNRKRLIQTDGDETFFAKSHLNLPLYVDPDYKSLFKGAPAEIKNVRTQRVKRIN